MSQKVHPRNLRRNFWLESNTSWFREQKLPSLLNTQWWLHQWSNSLFSKILLFRATKSVSRRRKKKRSYLLCSSVTRQIKDKVYLFPVLMPFPKKGYLRKYMPIKAVQKKKSFQKKRLQIHKNKSPRFEYYKYSNLSPSNEDLNPNANILIS